MDNLELVQKGFKITNLKADIPIYAQINVPGEGKAVYFMADECLLNWCVYTKSNNNSPAIARAYKNSENNSEVVIEIVPIKDQALDMENGILQIIPVPGGGSVATSLKLYLFTKYSLIDPAFPYHLFKNISKLTNKQKEKLKINYKE